MNSADSARLESSFSSFRPITAVFRILIFIIFNMGMIGTASAAVETNASGSSHSGWLSRRRDRQVATSALAAGGVGLEDGGSVEIRIRRRGKGGKKDSGLFCEEFRWEENGRGAAFRYQTGCTLTKRFLDGCEKTAIPDVSATPPFCWGVLCTNGKLTRDLTPPTSVLKVPTI
ncbi:hypothetical protein XPA_001947 [Xanthoria parietina]